mgnify:FL=1|jgi:hypothetical protein
MLFADVEPSSIEVTQELLCFDDCLLLADLIEEKLAAEAWYALKLFFGLFQ